VYGPPLIPSVPRLRAQVSVDEVGVRGSELVDKYGWAEKGARAIDYDVPENSGPRYEGVVAISQGGLVAIQFYTGGSVQWNNVLEFCAEELFPVKNPWPVCPLFTIPEP